MLLNATDRKHLFISLDAAVLRCCLFPAHLRHFATSIKLACGSDSDACYAAFLRSLTETFRGLNSCIFALTSNFLKAAVFQYFTSRVGERLMQLFCAAACFLFTSGTSLQASKLGWS